MTLAEINPLRELEHGSFVALDAHMDMENEARSRQKALLCDLGVGDEETRQAHQPTEFELAGEEVDGVDHRGVAGNVTEFDGNLGLVIGVGRGSLTLFDAVRSHGGHPANYCEIGGNPSVRKAAGRAKLVLETRRGQDRGDDVNRLQHPGGYRRPRRGQGLPRTGPQSGGQDRRLSYSRRLEDGATRSSRSTAWTTATAPSRCTRPLAGPWRGSRAPPPPELEPIPPRCARHRRKSAGRGASDGGSDRRIDDVHRSGHHRPRGRELEPPVPGVRRRRSGSRRRHAGMQGSRGARCARLRHRRPGG